MDHRSPAGNFNPCPPYVSSDDNVPDIRVSVQNGTRLDWGEYEIRDVFNIGRWVGLFA